MSNLKLNPKEAIVLKALIDQVVACTKDEFGYMEDVDREGFTKHEFAGYIGSLEKKGVFDYVGGEVAGQYALMPEAFEYFKERVQELEIGQNIMLTEDVANNLPAEYGTLVSVDYTSLTAIVQLKPNIKLGDDGLREVSVAYIQRCVSPKPVDDKTNHVKVSTVILSHLSDLFFIISLRKRNERLNFIKYLVMNFPNTEDTIDPDKVYKEYITLMEKRS